MELLPAKSANMLTDLEERQIPRHKFKIEVKERIDPTNARNRIFEYEGSFLVHGEDEYGEQITRYFYWPDRHVNNNQMKKLFKKFGLDVERAGEYEFELPLRIMFSKSRSDSNNDFGWTCSFQFLIQNEDKNVVSGLISWSYELRDLIIRNPSKMGKFIVLKDGATYEILKKALHKWEEQRKKKE